MILAEHANTLSAHNRLQILNTAQHLGESRLFFGKLCLSKLAEIMHRSGLFAVCSLLFYPHSSSLAAVQLSF